MSTFEAGAYIGFPFLAFLAASWILRQVEQNPEASDGIVLTVRVVFFAMLAVLITTIVAVVPGIKWG